MRTFRTTLAMVVILALAGAASAQQGRINADRLPINQERIRRELVKSSERVETDGLHLRYFVNIYGEVPALRLFLKEENLTTGPVPYGAPTHQEFLDHWTPQEFRAPVADFGAFLRWLSDRSKK